MSLISKPSFDGNFDRYILERHNDPFLLELKKKLIDSLGSENLEEIHKKISQENINETRIKAFRSINLIENWKKKLLDLIKPNIHEILGLDLAIQKNLNLSIQMPGDKNSILEKHMDFRTGDSPFQRVIWIPLTKSYSTNAMYMSDINDNYEPLNMDYGELLIFDPNTKHGNVENKTEHTRISINVRVKNWFSPDLSSEAPDRQFGVYYEDLCFSESTIRSFDLLKQSNYV